MRQGSCSGAQVRPALQPGSTGPPTANAFGGVALSEIAVLHVSGAPVKSDAAQANLEESTYLRKTVYAGPNLGGSGTVELAERHLKDTFRQTG